MPFREEIKKRSTLHKAGAADDIKSISSVRSLLSILSGKPDDDDADFLNILLRIGSGRYSPPLSLFSTTVRSPHEDPYEALWAKSPHGVYTVIPTVTPVWNKKAKEYDFEPSYSVIFCTHPHYLGELALWKEDELPAIDDNEFNRKMTIVRTHLAKDIQYQTKNDPTVKHPFDWALLAMREHRADYERRLLIHGTLIKDNDFLYRSGSSIFWLERDNTDPSKVNVNYYSNPIHGERGLFIRENDLENRLYRGFLRASSIKINEEPITLEDAHEFIREKFAPIANKLVRFGDPYDLYPPKLGKVGKGIAAVTRLPEEKLAKVMRFGKKAFSRNIQQNINLLTKVDFKSTGLKAGFALVGVFGLFLVTSAMTVGFMAGMAVLNSNKYGLAMRGLTKAMRAVKGALNIQPDRKKIGTFTDYSDVHAKLNTGNLYVDEGLGLPLNAEMAQDLHPVNRQMLGTPFAGAKPYSDKLERQWADSVIMDTKGYAPGTIFSQVDVNGRDYLKAEQANGINILYDTDATSAFAWLNGASYEYSCLEVPIKRRFEELEEGQKYVATQLNRHENVVSIQLGSLDDIPPRFKVNQMGKKQKKTHSEKGDIVHHDHLSKHPALYLNEKERGRFEKASWKKLKHEMGESVTARVMSYTARRTTDDHGVRSYEQVTGVFFEVTQRNTVNMEDLALPNTLDITVAETRFSTDRDDKKPTASRPPKAALS